MSTRRPSPGLPQSCRGNGTRQASRALSTEPGTWHGAVTKVATAQVCAAACEVVLISLHAPSPAVSAEATVTAAGGQPPFRRPAQPPPLPLCPSVSPFWAHPSPFSDPGPPGHVRPAPPCQRSTAQQRELNNFVKLRHPRPAQAGGAPRGRGQPASAIPVAPRQAPAAVMTPPSAQLGPASLSSWPGLPTRGTLTR